MTDAQINAAIAEHLMGWKLTNGGHLYLAGPGNFPEIPDWVNGADLEGLMQAAADKGLTPEVYDSRGPLPGFVGAASSAGKVCILCRNDSPSRALCEAILRALGKWVDA